MGMLWRKVHGKVGLIPSDLCLLAEGQHSRAGQISFSCSHRRRICDYGSVTF